MQRQCFHKSNKVGHPCSNWELARIKIRLGLASFDMLPVHIGSSQQWKEPIPSNTKSSSNKSCTSLTTSC